jgi:hypothetical protein
MRKAESLVLIASEGDLTDWYGDQCANTRKEAGSTQVVKVDFNA